MKILLVLLLMANGGIGVALTAMLLETDRWRENRWIKMALGFYLLCLLLPTI